MKRLTHEFGCRIEFPRERKGHETVYLTIAHANEYDLRKFAKWARQGRGGWLWLSGGVLGTVKGWRQMRDAARRCRGCVRARQAGCMQKSA